MYLLLLVLILVHTCTTFSFYLSKGICATFWPRDRRNHVSATMYVFINKEVHCRGSCNMTDMNSSRFLHSEKCASRVPPPSYVLNPSSWCVECCKRKEGDLMSRKWPKWPPVSVKEKNSLPWGPDPSDNLHDSVVVYSGMTRLPGRFTLCIYVNLSVVIISHIRPWMLCLCHVQSWSENLWRVGGPVRKPNLSFLCLFVCPFDCVRLRFRGMVILVWRHRYCILLLYAYFVSTWRFVRTERLGFEMLVKVLIWQKNLIYCTNIIS